jgi:hypothetical protein
LRAKSPWSSTLSKTADPGIQVTGPCDESAVDLVIGKPMAMLFFFEAGVFLLYVGIVDERIEYVFLGCSFIFAFVRLLNPAKS